MPKDCNNQRLLKPTELNLISILLGLCQLPYKLDLPLSETPVIDLVDDGGMGSFEFVCGSSDDRRFGEPLIQAETYDTDGRKIMLELSVDMQGYLYQLDSWTADWGPLVDPLGTITMLENVSIK